MLKLGKGLFWYEKKKGIFIMYNLYTEFYFNIAYYAHTCKLIAIKIMPFFKY